MSRFLIKSNKANDFNTSKVYSYMQQKKSIDCIPDDFLNKGISKIFLLKMKKIDKFGLNYHRYMVQPLVLSILRCSF